MLVIKRRHDEQPIRANGFRMLREFPRLGKIRGARRNDDVQAVAVLEGYAFFQTYGWFYHANRFDLMSFPRQ